MDMQSLAHKEDRCYECASLLYCEFWYFLILCKVFLYCTMCLSASCSPAAARPLPVTFHRGNIFSSKSHVHSKLLKLFAAANSELMSFNWIWSHCSFWHGSWPIGCSWDSGIIRVPARVDEWLWHLCFGGTSSNQTAYRPSKCRLYVCTRLHASLWKRYDYLSVISPCSSTHQAKGRISIMPGQCFFVYAVYVSLFSFFLNCLYIFFECRRRHHREEPAENFRGVRSPRVSLLSPLQ